MLTATKEEENGGDLQVTNPGNNDEGGSAGVSSFPCTSMRLELYQQLHFSWVANDTEKDGESGGEHGTANLDNNKGKGKGKAATGKAKKDSENQKNGAATRQKKETPQISLFFWTPTAPSQSAPRT